MARMTSYNEEQGHNPYCGGCEYCAPTKEVAVGAALVGLVNATQPILAQYRHTEEGHITEEMITRAWSALDTARSAIK